MNVLMLSLDRKVFEEGSAPRARIAAYGTIFDELHIIVYSLKVQGWTSEQIASNVWIYPTQSQSKFSYMRDSAKLAKHLHEKKPFSIVSGQDGADTGWIASRIARRFRLPLLLQDHADVFNQAFIREGLGNRMRSWIARKVFPRANLVRTVAEGSEAHLKKEVPSLSERTYLLPVYTDVDALRDRAPAFSLRERYPQYSKLLLTACRLVPQKNLELMLEAFALVHEPYPGSGLLILGEGPQQEMLEQKAVQLGLSDAVQFIPWQDDLVPYYKGADLFFMTSNYESYGRTLIEAAASGLPFVATDVGVARDLANADAGYVSEKGTASELAELVCRSLEGGSELSEAAGRGAVEAFQGKNLDEYLSRYKEMMEICEKSETKWKIAK